MKDLMQILQDADAASIEVERRREEVESTKVLWEIAKERFETAKKEFDQVLIQADELGIPRGKLRKLVEERTGSLLASGLMSSSNENRTAVKVPKLKKSKSKSEMIETEDVVLATEEDQDLSNDELKEAHV